MNNVFNQDTYLNTSIWVAPNWVASCWDVILLTAARMGAAMIECVKPRYFM